MGRWRRHIYQGIADTVERLRDLAKGTLLETPWRSLPAELQDVWLWGTGDQHITFTWRGGAAPLKYGGTFAGIIPELVSDIAIRKVSLSGASSKNTCGRCRVPDVTGSGLICRVGMSVSRRCIRNSAIIRPGLCRRFAGWRCGTRWSSFSSCSSGPTETLIATEVLKEIRGRLGFLMNVGLDYLTLDRTAPRCRAVNRNASVWLGRSVPAWSACYTFSMSLRSACIRATTSGCSTRSAGCATWATRSWSWSMTKRPFVPPTTSSTSVPAPACGAAEVVASGPVEAVIDNDTQHYRHVSFPAGKRSKFRRFGGPAAARHSRSSAPHTTTSKASTSVFRWASSSASRVSPVRARARS